MELNALKSVVWTLLTVISLSFCLKSTTAADPGTVLRCVLDNNTYICTGAQYRMHCNTRKHHFYYQRNQKQYQYQCLSNDCVCVGNNDTCECYYNTSSCFCETFSNNITIPTVSPILDCEFSNGVYICIGAQYHMYCDTAVNYFSYYIYQFQNQYQYNCWTNCNCVFTKTSCTCYGVTSSSCFCTNYGYSITPSSGQNPATVPDCALYNDTYICTGAQNRMYCNTKIHDFYYRRYQNQYLYECSNNCNCYGDMGSCSCSPSTLSSCFCETFGNGIALDTAVTPVSAPDCVLNNDIYTCTGAQYRMHCNTQVHYFSYQSYQNQDQYHCLSNNCNCIGNKDTCTCSTSTLSSCFCETYGNIIALYAAVSPVYDCVLFNDTYICAGAQYRMYCNTSMHDFYYWRYRNQNQYPYQCLNNNCNCVGNKDTCTCYSSTFSSCICEKYSNNITIPTAVSPLRIPQCELNNDLYICTGAQYRMYCNTSLHDFNYRKYSYQNQYQYQCLNNNCDCTGNKDTCTYSTSTLSSCFCETYGKIIALTADVASVYSCMLNNDTYICTGAQYRLYCNTSMHDFYFWRYRNQNQYQYQCVNNNCNCVGNKDTCTCYGSTFSSCICENYSNNITIPTTVTPLRIPQCELNNDLYICTGAQYRMYCNTSMHDFRYWKYSYQNQYQYQCWNYACDCFGNKDTCTYSTSTLSSCFCETYNIIALTAAVSPVYDCVLYNDTYICTGAQYRMYCNTSMHNLYYSRNEHRCSSSICSCTGNKNICSCSSSAPSSCYCTSYSNSITVPAAVSPVYDCGLYNDTYVCTGAQYRMYCNTTMHSFNYQRNGNQKQYQCVNNNCNCIGNKDTCTCSTSTLSSCFCGNNISMLTPTTAAPTITMTDKCKTSGGCLQSILQQLENIKELPLTVVTSVLDVAFNKSEISQSADSKELVENGNRLLKASEKLISALVKPTETSDNVSFTLATVEVKVFSIGPKFASENFPLLDTKNASMNIDLIEIAKNNEETRSAAVAFMSYTTMENLLKPELFNASNDTINTMMSTVISATLPKTTNTELTKPVNFTFRHIREFEPGGSLSCVYWNISEWIVDGCSVLNSNRSFTVCSCVHLSTFALIMQTSKHPPEDDPLLKVLNLVCVIVGLLFFSLSLLSFAFCQWSPGVNNVARINICISLLFAHLLFLITQEFLNLIGPQQVLCVVISALLHFLFLSGFVWMFIEAVLLFICVKNLSQISSKKKEVLSSGFLCVIGYVVALVVVSVSVGLVPEGYGSDKCWIKLDKGFIWSFLGPVCTILALNTILFANIVVSLSSALRKLNAEVSQMKQTKIMVFKTLGQFVVLGCPWFLGFWVSNNSNKMLKILFLVLNSQQGTFIFVIYCVLNNEIRQQYRKCFTSLCSGRKPKINREASKH